MDIAIAQDTVSGFGREASGDILGTEHWVRLRHQFGFSGHTALQSSTGCPPFRNALYIDPGDAASSVPSEVAPISISMAVLA